MSGIWYEACSCLVLDDLEALPDLIALADPDERLQDSTRTPAGNMEGV